MDGARAAAEAAVLEDERRVRVRRRAVRDHERRGTMGWYHTPVHRCVVLLNLVGLSTIGMTNVAACHRVLNGDRLPVPVTHFLF